MRSLTEAAATTSLNRRLPGYNQAHIQLKAMVLTLGTRLGPYEVVVLIGSGGLRATGVDS